MEKKLYEKVWFIVLLSILTLGMYALYFYGIKRFGKKFAIYATVAIVGLAALSSALTPKGEAEYTYEIKESSVTFEQPAIPAQEAVYGEPQVTKLQKGNYVGGQDLPAGSYNVAISSGTMCQLKVDGKLVLNNSTTFGADCTYNNLVVKEGSSIEVIGDTLAFTGKGEMISPAKPATPAKTVEEKLVWNEFEEVCYIGSEETDCSKLSKYDELMNTLDKTDEVTEKVRIYGDSETCYVDTIATPCDELRSYDKLSSEIVVE